MLITASLGNIVGCIACLLFAGLNFYCFKLAVDFVKPQKNPNDIVGHSLIAVSLLNAIGCFLVPVGFLLMAYLERNPQVLDFLR